MTKEQIKNFRKVLTLQHGPLIQELEDEDIVKVRDYIQSCVDKNDMQANIHIKLASICTDRQIKRKQEARRNREKGFAYEDKPTKSNWFQKALERGGGVR